MKFSVVGLGYVGVSLVVVLAEKGFSVVGIQRRSPRSGWKINWVNKGRSPIFGEEPGLAELLAISVQSGCLRATDDYGEVKDSDVVVITVQTPVDENKEPDLSHLTAACAEVGRNLQREALVCVESTVPPGTTDGVARAILENESGFEAGVDFNLVFSYERVTPGHLIENLKTLPRVVGGLTPQCTERGVEFYSRICESTIFKTDCVTAETSKLIENSHRDVNIAFANEAAMVCRSLGVDFYAVRKMVNSLPMRQGSSNPYRNVLEPGAGVGGHCLPKDSHLLLSVLRQKKGGYKPRLIPLSREINDGMPEIMNGLIREGLAVSGREIADSKIGVLGLSYKEDTGDPRNSPTLRLHELLKGNIVVHDPFIQDHPLIKTQPLIDAIQGSDCLVVMTKHSEYKTLNLKCIASMMRTRVIVDGRDLFDPNECLSHGFIYRGIGHVAD
jgi:UDP-N-acetyl-D-mannosaminuronic acid dehydrogenase